MLISANNNHDDDVQNDLNHRRMKEILTVYNLSFKEVYGTYQGKREISFAVVNRDEDTRFVKFLLAIAKTFKQESILHLDEKRKATLLFCDGIEYRLRNIYSYSTSYCSKLW